MPDLLIGWAMALTALVCLVAHYLPEIIARAEERRRVHDADAFNAQLAAMTPAEIEAADEWAAVMAVADGTDVPLYNATALYLASGQLNDPAIERWLR
jgi:hypothetical protein